ncbi:MAG TPA: type III pantothenate kinase [Phycisphaerales bacterium]|nr:type III pantothenate kinase [Phycisphaerales bacterium]HRQ75499.1 type III pantothenate kinase [Phycisphaerales bacterium]
MPPQPPHHSNTPTPPIVAINVGNTRTQFGRFVDGQLEGTDRLDNKDVAAIVNHVVEQWRSVAEQPNAAIIIASVNDPLADRVASAIEDQLTVEVYRIGDDLPVPIGRQLDPETITGVDRLLNAAAAYESLGQACVIVDAGTAVTVDFVDGEGTFHGGAIAPGARMQLRALHEHTSALPELEFQEPEKEAFGRNTAQAMLQGVYHGIRGMVWRLVEQYAERYGAYPTVIATGGDAHVLFGEDELIDRIVPELTLHGIACAARHAMASHDE